MTTRLFLVRVVRKVYGMMVVCMYLHFHLLNAVVVML